MAAEAEGVGQCHVHRALDRGVERAVQVARRVGRVTPLRNEIETRDSSLLEHVTDLATEAIAARFGNGPVSGKIRGHIVAAAR